MDWRGGDGLSVVIRMYVRMLPCLALPRLASGLSSKQASKQSVT